jgi:hypothetical protein
VKSLVFPEVQGPRAEMADPFFRTPRVDGVLQ